MNPYTQGRGTVKAALKTIDGIGVHDWPQSTIQPPCLVILPARSGWIDSRGRLSLLVRAYAASTGGGGLERLEDLVHRTRGALRDAALPPGSTESPTVADEGFVSCDIPVSLRVTTI